MIRGVGMKKLLVLLSLLLALIIGFPAQAQVWRDSSVDRRERLENLRIWKMTEFMELTPEQAELFFPRLRILEKRLQKQRKAQSELLKDMREKLNQQKTTIDAQTVKVVTDEMARIEQDLVREKQQFILQLENIISPKQQIRYILFEVQFQNRLKKMLEQQTDERQSPRKK
jgi:hypothetical protein